MNWWVLRRRSHVSWLIAILCMAILVGVYLAKYIQVTPFSSLAFLLSAVLITGIGLWRRYIYLIPVIILGGVAVGLWRGTIQNNELAGVKNLYGF